MLCRPIADRLVWHLTHSMQLALEVSMEVWLGLLAYRNHSSLLDAKRSATLAAEVQNQAELVIQPVVCTVVCTVIFLAQYNTHWRCADAS